MFGQKYRFISLSSRTPSIRASEKNVDQYQDLSAQGCTLNWLVKKPGNEPEFLKNSNQLKLKLMSFEYNEWIEISMLFKDFSYPPQA